MVWCAGGRTGKHSAVRLFCWWRGGEERCGVRVSGHTRCCEAVMWVEMQGGALQGERASGEVACHVGGATGR